MASLVAVVVSGIRMQMSTEELEQEMKNEEQENIAKSMTGEELRTSASPSVSSVHTNGAQAAQPPPAPAPSQLLVMADPEEDGYAPAPAEAKAAPPMALLQLDMEENDNGVDVEKDGRGVHSAKNQDQEAETESSKGSVQEFVTSHLAEQSNSNATGVKCCRYMQDGKPMCTKVSYADCCDLQNNWPPQGGRARRDCELGCYGSISSRKHWPCWGVEGEAKTIGGRFVWKKYKRDGILDPDQKSMDIQYGAAAATPCHKDNAPTRGKSSISYEPGCM